MVRLPFPILGTDQGWALGDQPPGTTPNLLNVRALDWRNRQGGGKRNGHSKAITALAGIEGTRRITGLISFSAATGTPVGDAATEVAIDDDFSGYSIATPTDLGDNWIVAINLTTSAINGTVGVSANGLEWNNVESANFATLCRMLAARFPTTNDVTATLRCRPDANSTNTNNGGADDCQAFGPFIRGSTVCKDVIVAVLRRNAADTSVVLRIERWTEDVTTVLGTSDPLTISAGATVVEDLTIRLYEEGANVVAVLNWPSESLSNITLTVATTQNSGNTRAGVCVCPIGDASDFTVAAWRTFARVQLTMLQPPSPVVAYTLSRLLAGTNRYYIPPGWTAYSTNQVTPATVAQQVGPYDSNTALAAGNTIDTSAATFDVLVTSGTTTLARTGGFIRTDDSDGPFNLEVQLMENNSTLQNGFDVLLRVSADRRSFLRFTVAFQSGSATLATTNLVRITSNCALVKHVDGVLSTIDASIPELVGLTVRCGATWMRFSDDGANITISIDGMVAYIIPTIELAENGKTIGFGNNGTSGTGFGVEAARLLPQSGFVDLHEADPVIAVYTSGKIQIADTEADTLENTTGVGLTKALPMGFGFNQKFYAVDGEDSKITDPADNSTVDWANEVLVNGLGTFPAGCRLAALYRGRAVLARTASQPWMWYMGRVGFPLDFDYLNSNANGGVATAANYGTNADVGVPGDIITALIPFSDDFMYFGCASSIWIMEGDPGYDGAIQNVTYRTGVVGPRAWAFDDKGNLYFVGAAGLYRMVRGGRDPVNISGRRLINLLDALPLDQTLIQLAWDASGGYLNIYLTPTDGATAGHHCIYDPAAPRGGAYWIDQYPAKFGPWAVCETNGVEDIDRRLIIGGNDGQLRRPDAAAFTDDGEAIDSWVEIGPFELEGGAVYSMVQELQAMLGAGSGVVTWYWFTADSPEEVASLGFGSEVATGTWSNPGSVDGFQPPVGLRITGGAHKIRIRQNTATVDDRWSLEKVAAQLVPTGRRRL